MRLCCGCVFDKRQDVWSSARSRHLRENERYFSLGVNETFPFHYTYCFEEHKSFRTSTMNARKGKQNLWISFHSSHTTQRLLIINCFHFSFAGIFINISELKSEINWKGLEKNNLMNHYRFDWYIRRKLSTMKMPARNFTMCRVNGGFAHAALRSGNEAITIIIRNVLLVTFPFKSVFHSTVYRWFSDGSVHG